MKVFFFLKEHFHLVLYFVLVDKYFHSYPVYKYMYILHTYLTRVQLIMTFYDFCFRRSFKILINIYKKVIIRMVPSFRGSAISPFFCILPFGHKNWQFCSCMLETWSHHCLLIGFSVRTSDLSECVIVVLCPMSNLSYKLLREQVTFN